MRPNASLISYDQFLTGRGEKKPVSCRVGFPTSLMFDMPFGLPSYTMLVLLYNLFTLASDTFFVDTQCDPVWCNLRLLVNPHPASPQPMSADVVSTQRTKCKKRWALNFWKIQKCATQPNTGYLYCSIGSPYFLFASSLSRDCGIPVRFLRLKFLTFQKSDYSDSYDPLSYYF